MPINQQHVEYNRGSCVLSLLKWLGILLLGLMIIGIFVQEENSPLPETLSSATPPPVEQKPLLKEGFALLVQNATSRQDTPYTIELLNQFYSSWPEARGGLYRSAAEALRSGKGISQVLDALESSIAREGGTTSECDVLISYLDDRKKYLQEQAERLRAKSESRGEITRADFIALADDSVKLTGQVESMRTRLERQIEDLKADAGNLQSFRDFAANAAPLLGEKDAAIKLSALLERQAE